MVTAGLFRWRLSTLSLARADPMGRIPGRDNKSLGVRTARRATTGGPARTESRWKEGRRRRRRRVLIRASFVWIDPRKGADHAAGARGTCSAASCRLYMSDDDDGVLFFRGLLIAIMGSLPLWVGLLLFAEWAV